MVNESNFDKIDKFEDRLVRFDNEEFFLVRKLQIIQNRMIELTQRIFLTFHIKLWRSTRNDNQQMLYLKLH
jgi:hypothetical protein